MLKLKDRHHVPPDPGFQYRQPETGASLDGRSFDGTVALMVIHRTQNNLPRATDAEADEDLEKQLCIRLGQQWCSNTVAKGFRSDWNTIVEGTKSLTSWAVSALSGENPYVEPSEAQRRAEICVKCFANQRGGGCTSCGFGDLVRKLLSEVPGTGTTTVDDRLNTCLVCGCLLQKKVHLKRSVIDRWSSQEQKAAFAQIPHCWMNE